MVQPRKIKAKELRAQPYLLWNEFIDLVGTSRYEALSEPQRVAHLAFVYDGEVQNGGHLQYFENCGLHREKELIRALECLGASHQRDIFREASVRYRSRPRRKIRSVREYCATAREGEFADLDEAYYACDPDMMSILERFLAEHEAAFIERVEA